MPSERSLSTNDQEHVRLLKALRESEVLRELSELLASSLDPTRILQVLVKRTTELCDVERCSVWLLDEPRSSLQPSAYHLASTQLKRQDIEAADRVWRRSSLSSNDPVFQRLLRENGILALENLRAEASMRIIAEKFFVQSILLVALLREGRPVGMMCLDNPGKSCTFSIEQQQLARSIGQQAAVAIDNARLYQQAQDERRRAERLIGRAQSIYQVAMTVNSDKDLPSVLEIAAQHLVHGLDADGATIALLEGDTLSVLRTTRLHPLPSTTPEPYIIPGLNDLPHCLAAAERRMPIFVPAEQLEGIEKLWYRQAGLENVMIVPLMPGTHSMSRQMGSGIASNVQPETIPSVGFAFVTYHEATHPPSAGQRAFAQDIAAQCALAIEKANLLANARRAAMLATERANTLDAVFNAMTEGIIVLDMEGRVIVTNNTAAHFIGMPKGIEQQLLDYLEKNPIYTVRGHRIAPVDFPLARGLRGEHVRGERFITRRADGSERIIETNIASLFDSEASKIGIVGAFRDITEQVRIEKRVRGALDTMLHAAEAVSGVLDTYEMLQRVLSMTLDALNSERGVIQLYDQEQQSFTPLLSIGFSAQEEAQWLAEQQHWLVPEEDQYAGFRAQLQEGHATLVSAEQCPDQQIDILHHTMILAAPITHNNQLLGLMMLDRSSILRRETSPAHEPGATRPLPRNEFSVWDIAVVEGIAQFAGLAIEQARWQQEAGVARMNEATMRESNKMKDEFLAITAHEFRTPLTIILAHSQMMARLLKRIADVDQTIQDKFHDSISHIETQTHQLTNIVNTFLEVTRLNRGQIELTVEQIDLEAVVKQAAELHRPTSPSHAISHTIKSGKYAYHIMGDKARLLQIFANLLQNAIKYSPFGGPISISLRQSKDKEGWPIAEVCVADEGIGVPKEAQSRLFERFYRAPNIEGSQTRGVGLGLYVVAEFLRLHGGTIYVESSGVEGEGSRFTFTLPLVDGANHQSQRAEEKGQPTGDMAL